MRRLVLAALALTLAAVTPARAALSLGGAPDGLQALAVAGGAAYAVVSSGDRATPFALVRSDGRVFGAPQPFGERGAEFPDVGAGTGGAVLVSWSRPVSQGDRYAVAAAPLAPGAPFGPAQAMATGTGPGRLALGPGDEPVLAYPNGQGDAALARGGAEQPLTASAPELRHLPLDLAVDAEGRAFVLELVQTRGHSELRLLGPGAPTAPAVSVDELRDMRATLAVDGGRAYVAFLLDGRVGLAIAALEPGAAWWTRNLPGRGGGSGAPAVLRTTGQTLVVYTQRQRHGRGDVFLSTEGPGPLATRRLTRTRADERGPFAAAGVGGELYLGWSRGRALHGSASAVLERLR
jgi:hypothetical protein